MSLAIKARERVALVITTKPANMERFAEEAKKTHLLVDIEERCSTVWIIPEGNVTSNIDMDNIARDPDCRYLIYGWLQFKPTKDGKYYNEKTNLKVTAARLGSNKQRLYSGFIVFKSKHSRVYGPIPTFNMSPMRRNFLSSDIRKTIMEGFDGFKEFDPTDLYYEGPNTLLDKKCFEDQGAKEKPIPHSKCLIDKTTQTAKLDPLEEPYRLLPLKNKALATLPTLESVGLNLDGGLCTVRHNIVVTNRDKTTGRIISGQNQHGSYTVDYMDEPKSPTESMHYDCKGRIGGGCGPQGTYFHNYEDDFVKK